jgi:hypothetical protein
MRYYVDTIMDKHYLPTDTKTEPSEAPTLPDRTSLSKLYPDPKPSNAVVEVKPSILDNDHLAGTIRHFAIKIGLLTPLPFIIGLVPAILFYIYATFDNIFQMLPLMTITMIAWGLAIVLVFRQVATYLDRLSVSSSFFLSLHFSCLLLVAPMTYYIAQLVAPGMWLGQLIFSILILGLSVCFSWLFLQLILNDTLTDKSRLKLISLILFLCLVSSACYIVIKQL